MDFVYFDGKRTRLVATLGGGGEGNVFEDETGQAVKVFTDKASPIITQLRERKIRASAGLGNLSKPGVFDIYKPDALGTDEHDRFTSYRMRKFPKGILMIGDLTSRDVWESSKLNQAKILRVFLNLHDMLTTLHSTPVDRTKPPTPDNVIVYGDLSGVNVGFNAESKQLEVIGCDFDACQYGAANPCIFGTLDFVAPRLYGTDLSTMKHPFLPEDDWWSYTINLFNSLFRFPAFIKPEPNSNTPDLVIRGAHIFKPGAKHPSLRRAALPLRSMPDSLLELFLDIFTDKRVDSFPRQILEETEAHLKECQNHSPMFFVYTAERPECPHCAKDAEIPDLTQLEVKIGMKINEFYALPQQRRIVFMKSIMFERRKQRTFVLDVDSNDNMRAVWMEATGLTREVAIPMKYEAGMTFDVNENTLLIANLNGQSTIFSIDVKTVFAATGVEKAPQVATFPVGMYRNRPVVSLGATAPIWLIGNTMEKGEMLHKRMMSETIMNMGSPITTWFTTSSHLGEDYTVGFEDVITRNSDGSAETFTRWFLITKGKFQELSLPKSRSTKLVDWKVVFDRNSFAIVRLLQEGNNSPLVNADVFVESALLFSVAALATGQRLEGEPALLNKRLAIPSENGILMYDGKKLNGVLSGTEQVSLDARLVGLLRVPETNQGAITNIEATRGDLYLAEGNRLYKVTPVS